MALQQNSGDYHERGFTIPLPPNTRYETSVPIQQSQNHQPAVTKYTASSLDITPLEDEKPEISRPESQDDMRPIHYAPIRGVIEDGDGDEKFKKTVGQIWGDISEDERSKLHRLASSMHRTESYQSASGSALGRRDTLAGVTDDDPRLNPSKPDFDIYVWARAFMRAMDLEGIKARRAGFAFKNLNVTGSGAAINIQKDFASVFMAPFRLGEYFSFGSKPEKKILRNFNGVVKSGEMLVVLGRPGSGCSTFLKTLCGELAGLNLDKNSVIHYNGMCVIRIEQFMLTGHQVFHNTK